MIIINNEAYDISAILKNYPENGVESVILNTLSSSEIQYPYSSPGELEFELKLRREIIKAADDQNKSRLSFGVFRESTCNPDFWIRQEDGGFALKQGVKPNDAIRDIYNNSSLYRTECATAILIVYFKALAEVFPEDLYNSVFSNIYLMNWHRIEREIRDVGLMRTAKDFMPGDRRYFNNPDVDPLTPEFQGENVIDMGNGIYYGHGIGKARADVFVRALNNVRKQDSELSAYIMDMSGNPNYKYLYDIYKRAVAETGDARQSA